jgi:hypothetical protein
MSSVHFFAMCYKQTSVAPSGNALRATLVSARGLVVDLSHDEGPVRQESQQQHERVVHVEALVQR